MTEVRARNDGGSRPQEWESAGEDSGGLGSGLPLSFTVTAASPILVTLRKKAPFKGLFHICKN